MNLFGGAKKKENNSRVSRKWIEVCGLKLCLPGQHFTFVPNQPNSCTAEEKERCTKRDFERVHGESNENEVLRRNSEGVFITMCTADFPACECLFRKCRECVHKRREEERIVCFCALWSRE